MEGLTEDWEPIDMVIQVAEVKKILGSVEKIISAGNRVVFDLYEGSYIQNKRTSTKTQVYRKNGVFQFDVYVPKRKGRGQSGQDQDSK